MKNIIVTLALLFLSCQGENSVKPSQCFKMTISDALPVQFWLNDCETYNEKEVCGVHRFCFCQPWECDDQIKIQFTDDLPGEIPPLASFANTGAGTSWTIDSQPDVSLAGLASSKFLYAPLNIKKGRSYNFVAQLTTGSGSGQFSIRLAFLDASSVEVNAVEVPVIDAGPFTINLPITADSNIQSQYVAVRIINNAGAAETFTLTSLTFDGQWKLVVYGEDNQILSSEEFEQTAYAGGYVFSITLILSENSPDLCNRQIRLQIEVLGTMYAKSDCLHIKDEWECSHLIEYSNNRDYAGLVYDDQSPESSFYLRIPAVFFHEDFPEEDEDIELTSGVQTLNSTMFSQRQLETDYMPYYMHKKLKLVLKHQVVTIDNLNWVKREAYEIEKGNKRYPKKKATVMLNESDFVARNVV